MTKEEFIGECAFAKIVNTPRGAAILIAGEVIEVQCSPDGPYRMTVEGGIIPALVAALRSNGSERILNTAG